MLAYNNKILKVGNGALKFPVPRPVWTYGTFSTTRGPTYSSKYGYLIINSNDINSTLLNKNLYLWYSDILSPTTSMSKSNKVNYGNVSLTNGNAYQLYPAIVQFESDSNSNLYTSSNKFSYMLRSNTPMMSWVPSNGGSSTIYASRTEAAAFSMNRTLGTFNSNKRTLFCFVGNSNYAISLADHIVMLSTNYSPISINYKYKDSAMVTVPRQIF